MRNERRAFKALTKSRDCNDEFGKNSVGAPVPTCGFRWVPYNSFDLCCPRLAIDCAVGASGRLGDEDAPHNRQFQQHLQCCEEML